mgnify:CR=1 FL=1
MAEKTHQSVNITSLFMCALLTIAVAYLALQTINDRHQLNTLGQQLSSLQQDHQHLMQTSKDNTQRINHNQNNQVIQQITLDQVDYPVNMLSC